MQKQDKLFKELAQRALDIQDACNLRGLAASFLEVLDSVGKILDSTGVKTRVADHPIIRLWVSKLHDLSNMACSNTERYSEAYRYCRVLAGLEDNETQVTMTLVCDSKDADAVKASLGDWFNTTGIGMDAMAIKCDEWPSSNTKTFVPSSNLFNG